MLVVILLKAYCWIEFDSGILKIKSIASITVETFQNWKDEIYEVFHPYTPERREKMVKRQTERMLRQIGIEPTVIRVGEHRYEFDLRGNILREIDDSGNVLREFF